MDLLTMAGKRHALAADEYATASFEFETALVSGDADRRRAAGERLRCATEALGVAMADLADTRRRVSPTLEEWLREPACQPDVDAVVLGSVQAFSKATPATAGYATAATREAPAQPTRSSPRWLGDAVKSSTPGLISTC